jgi:16S rRNA (cytidine1402-2'-O)-methyltransferase
LTCLYIVATPIGNLQDITLRAIEILKTVDLIAAEDTRHSRSLLNHFGISTRLISYREHNETASTQGLIKTLQAGQSVALISDAGTPLISDPGYRLVKTAKEAGIQVIPIPGASAIVAALCAAGMATDRFSFQGFLPAKRVGRQRHLQTLLIETQTLVFYEAPHRINETLDDVVSIFGAERTVTLARELTKRFEQIWQGSAIEASTRLQSGEIPARGEFVLLVAGADSDQASAVHYEAARIMKLLLPEMPPRRAADIASQITGENKKGLYELAVQLRQQGELTGVNSPAS